jgi:hypothetical protein
MQGQLYPRLMPPWQQQQAALQQQQQQQMGLLVVMSHMLERTVMMGMR